MDVYSIICRKTTNMTKIWYPHPIHEYHPRFFPSNHFFGTDSHPAFQEFEAKINAQALHMCLKEVIVSGKTTWISYPREKKGHVQHRFWEIKNNV